MNMFQVVEISQRIQGWNRRAKGIPQYFGRLIHAVDFLRLVKIAKVFYQFLYGHMNLNAL